MFKKNQKVIYNGNKHKTCPYFYPKKGTIGKFQYYETEGKEDICYVEFSPGSIQSSDYCTLVYVKDIKLLEEETSDS